MIILRKEDTLVIEDKDNVIDNIYYLEESLPTNKDVDKYLKTNKNKNDPIVDYFATHGIDHGIELIRKAISKIEDKIPLYDVYSENIYLIGKYNVYERVVYHNYRFPNKDLFNILVVKYDKIKNKDITDPLKKRKRHKLFLMIDFLQQFDLDEMFKTYTKVFYLYSENVGQEITVCKRPSFISHLSHLKPYYTKSDLINIALNMGFDIKLSDAELCKLVSENDISAKTLIKHQLHMIDEDRVGLVQYYTLQGSYFMNQYLREIALYDYRNLYLESLITPMWQLIKSAPAFDKEYILYRFITSDQHIKNIKVGDVYIEKGFTSTTRDPFYRPDLYKFGFILVKIKVPKNVVGVALCVETLSYFPDEQEIILAPLSMLRLDARDTNCEYYHTNKSFSAEVKTRYEFTLIGNKPIEYIERPIIHQSLPLNFITLEGVDTMSLEEKIRYFIAKHVNKIYQFQTKIGNNIYTVMTERYDSTGAYKKFFAVANQNGLLLYSLHNNYTIFMIEIGEINGTRYMHVDFNVKYKHKREDYTDEEYIRFISSVAYYFAIDRVIMWSEFETTDKRDKVDNKSKIKQISRMNKLRKIKRYSLQKGGVQRGFSNDNTTIDPTVEPIEDITNNTVNNTANNIITDDIDNEQIGGGTYSIDFYLYLKNNIKRYESIDNIELQPKFSYHLLDRMRKVEPTAILRKTDLDEIYQIYDKIFKPSVNKTNNNLAIFYVWMVDNYGYMIDILTKKLGRLYRIDNPFDLSYYILDPLTYLYNRKLINTYPTYIAHGLTTHITEEIPQNKYRLIRT